MTLVASGDAPESPVGRSAIGQIPGGDREPFVDAVGRKVKALSWPGEGVERGSAVVRVHGPHRLGHVHTDPVETVQSKAVPEAKPKNRHDCLVIQQATERLSPIEEAMIGTVLARGGAKADAF